MAEQSPVQQLIQSLAGIQTTAQQNASNSANNGNPNTVYNTSNWGYGGPPVMDSGGSWSNNQFSPAAVLQGLNLNLGGWTAPQGTQMDWSWLRPTLPEGGIVPNPNWPPPVTPPVVPPTTPPVVVPEQPPITGGNGGGGTPVPGGGGGTGTIVRPENPGGGGVGVGWGGTVGTGGNSNTGVVTTGPVEDIGAGGGRPLTPEQLEAGYGGSIIKDPNSPLNPGVKPGDNTKQPVVLDTNIFNPNSGSILSQIANSGVGQSIGMNSDGSMRWEQIVDMLSEPWIQGDLFMSQSGQWNIPNIVKGLANILVPGAGSLLTWLAGKGLFGQAAKQWVIDGKLLEAENEMVKMMEQEERFAAERAAAAEQEKNPTKNPLDRTTTRERGNNNNRTGSVQLITRGQSGSSSRGAGGTGSVGIGTVEDISTKVN